MKGFNYLLLATLALVFPFPPASSTSSDNSSTSTSIRFSSSLPTKIRTYGNGFYLTHNEETLLDRFRPMVEKELYQPWMKGDNYLIKFIRARNFDLDGAAEMLKQAIEWRKRSKIDELIKTQNATWTRFEQLFPFIISGQDKKKGPIFYILIGAYDIRKAILGGHYNTLERHYDRSFEKAMVSGSDLYERTGENVALEGTLIIDCNGANLRQHACTRCLQLWVHVIQSYEGNYPQGLRKVILINAPRAVETILAVMRPFMSKHTSEMALEVYGPNKEEWKPVLKNYIEPDQLLIRYGGTRKLDSLTSVTIG